MMPPPNFSSELLGRCYTSEDLRLSRKPLDSRSFLDIFLGEFLNFR